MIEVAEAVDRILAQIRPLPEEVIATATAMGNEGKLPAAMLSTTLSCTPGAMSALRTA